MCKKIFFVKEDRHTLVEIPPLESSLYKKSDKNNLKCLENEPKSFKNLEDPKSRPQ
jgi:hypothetical protein